MSGAYHRVGSGVTKCSVPGVRIGLAVLILQSSLTVVASETTDAMLKELGGGSSQNFTAEAGFTIWYRDNDGRSCTTCHTQSVRTAGRHERTGKIIKPMAPSINPERLTDRKKINKWLLRNCKWTLGRECTDEEKGNILVWLSEQ